MLHMLAAMRRVVITVSSCNFTGSIRHVCVNLSRKSKVQLWDPVFAGLTDAKATSVKRLTGFSSVKTAIDFSRYPRRQEKKIPAHQQN